MMITAIPSSLPLAGFALVIMVVFLHLPMEHENMTQKFKRIDYLGMLSDEIVKTFSGTPHI